MITVMVANTGDQVVIWWSILYYVQAIRAVAMHQESREQVLLVLGMLGEVTPRLDLQGKLAQAGLLYLDGLADLGCHNKFNQVALQTHFGIGLLLLYYCCIFCHSPPLA